MRYSFSTDNVKSLLLEDWSPSPGSTFAVEEAARRKQQKLHRDFYLQSKRVEQKAREHSLQARQLERHQKEEFKVKHHNDNASRYLNYPGKPFDFISHQYMPEHLSKGLREHDNQDEIRKLARCQRLERLNKAGYNVINGESTHWTKAKVPSELANRYDKYYTKAEDQYHIKL